MLHMISVHGIIVCTHLADRFPLFKNDEALLKNVEEKNNKMLYYLPYNTSSLKLSLKTPRL